MKLKTFLVCLTGLLFLVPLSTPSHATVDAVCFDGYFVRATGEPVTVFETFPGIDGPATVRLHRGERE